MLPETRFPDSRNPRSSAFRSAFICVLFFRVLFFRLNLPSHPVQHVQRRQVLHRVAALKRGRVAVVVGQAIQTQRVQRRYAILAVTIWMQQTIEDRFRLVTLKPAR